jgi:hypothetical protein
MAFLSANVWRNLLGVDRQTVIESVDFDEEADSIVVHVRPRRSKKRRCAGLPQSLGHRALTRDIVPGLAQPPRKVVATAA